MSEPSIYLVSDLSDIGDCDMVIELMADGYVRVHPEYSDIGELLHFERLIKLLEEQDKIDKHIEISDGKESFLIYQKKQEK